ncbi:ATP-binding domain-containing protein, partial [Bacillus subtilis]|uniref:ATP-binding domain-containing protein n=1 Tax=Bacillus subtilis TaxID=1423 RepID=UPI0023EB1CC0
FNRDNKRNKVVVTYSTRVAQEYNKLIRRKLQNMEDAPISNGDLVVFSKNQYDLLVMDDTSNEFNEDFFTGDIAEIIATYDRKSSNVRVNNQDVTLSYVKVKYRLERTGKEYVSYLLENVLNSDDSQLSSDERTALFYDAEERIGITETPEEHRCHIKSNNEYWEAAVKKLANVGESGLSVSDKDRIRELLRKHPICDPKNECERYQLLDKIYQDKFYNSIQVKYAYAMTGHKVQGNEWNDVYVDFTDRNGLDEASLRWTYTALSRAIKNVLVFNATSLFGNFDISNEFIGKKKNLEKERETATKIEEYQFNDEKITRLVDKVEEISENNSLVVTNIDDRNFEKQYFVLIYLSDVENNNYVMQAYYNSRKFWTKATLRSKVEIADKLELIG